MNRLLFSYFILTNGSNLMKIDQTIDFEPNNSLPLFNHTIDSQLTQPLIQMTSLNGVSSAGKFLEKFNWFPLPDPYPVDKIQPMLVFYKLGIDEYHVNYDSDPNEVAKNLSQKGFLDTKRLIILTHGFHNDFNTEWLHQFKNDILNVSAQQKVPQTVAILGWGNGANIILFWYRQAAVNVLPVGDWLANYTKAIKQVNSSAKIYGIGHSLGAHVLGIAGRLSNTFNRITETGLDPAGPCFENVTDSQTLRSTDAQFVDVIHTDGYDSKLDPSEWLFPVNHYGMLVPIGSIDFYPNYGYHQPGAGTFRVAGSHLRSLELFQWSIKNPGKFITNQILNKTPEFDCPVTTNTSTQYKTEMGYHADQLPLPPKNFSTLYYLPTNKQIPWV